jgi:hypothetical protein
VRTTGPGEISSRSKYTPRTFGSVYSSKSGVKKIIGRRVTL